MHKDKKQNAIKKAEEYQFFRLLTQHKQY